MTFFNILNKKKETPTIAKIVTAQAITIIINGQPHMIDRSNEHADALLEALIKNDEETILNIIDTLNRVNQWATDKIGDIEILDNDTVIYKGEVLKNAVTARILDWMRMGLDPTPLVNFLDRVMKNPSYTARQELMLFLENSDMPIMEDGRFTAYKIVRNDYLDIYSRTFSNKVGDKPTVDRGSVDDNRDNTCSKGLHFCSAGYVPHYGFIREGGDRLMLVAVDPEDVVSIPRDYSNAKGRACSYEVIAEVGKVQDFKGVKIYNA